MANFFFSFLLNSFSAIFKKYMGILCFPIQQLYIPIHFWTIVDFEIVLTLLILKLWFFLYNHLKAKDMYIIAIHKVFT